LASKLLLFDRVFSELFVINFNPQFFGTEVVLKLLFICSLEMVVGSLWKESTYTLQLLLGAPLTEQYSHITIAVGGHSESNVLAY